MPAYIVVDIEVQRPAEYERYKELAPPSIARYGGRYLARGGTTEVLEGTYQPTRLVILEFPSAKEARAWWASRATPLPVARPGATILAAARSTRGPRS